MQTIFHFAGLSRCSRLPLIEQCEDVGDCLVPVIFIRTKWKKWHEAPDSSLGLRNPRSCEGVNGLLEAFIRTNILSLRQKKLLRLLPLWVWDVRVESLTRWEPLHAQWTRLQALQICLAATASDFVGHGRRWENLFTATQHQICL